ncbi:MAG: hypothetical protein AAFR35_03800 [Pseudomonadota bacterium]
MVLLDLQDHATMGDDLPLDGLLTKLASAGLSGPGPRIIARLGGADPLAAILSEIDETVLPRTLDFSTDAGRRVHCDVVGRRLLKVSDIVSPSPLPGQAALLGADLDASQGDAGDRLRAMFLGAMQGADILSVEAHMLGRDVAPGEVGISAALLADMWGFALDPDPPTDAAAVLGGFLSAIEQNVQAGIWMHGEEADSFGEEATLARLGPPVDLDAAAGELVAARIDPLEPAPLLATRMSGGDVRVIARFGDQVLVLLVNADAEADIAQHWRCLTGA